LNVKFNIQEIITGCLKEQPKYQRVLVEKYSGLLYSICLRYMKDQGFANDCLQESLMRIFQNLDKYSFKKGSFEAWITTITIRHCLSKLSKKKLTIISTDEIQANSNHTLETDFLDAFETELLMDMIADLPDGYRSVFNLAAIDGYSHKEISELLGIQIVASRTRLNRAKKILREKVLLLKKNESWVNTI